MIVVPIHSPKTLRACAIKGASSARSEAHFSFAPFPGYINRPALGISITASSYCGSFTTCILHPLATISLISGLGSPNAESTTVNFIARASGSAFIAPSICHRPVCHRDWASCCTAGSNASPGIPFNSGSGAISIVSAFRAPSSSHPGVSPGALIILCIGL